jgi:dihydroxyacetone kinase-like protein
MNADTVRKWLNAASVSIHEQRDYLTQLDAAIGDADHGANMCHGFSTLTDAFNALDGASTPGALLIVAGGAFDSEGGASGVLWGTALKRAGRALGKVQQFDGTDLAIVLEDLLAGIVQLGAAEEGDKTMVDALAPASRAFRKMIDANATVAKAMAAAAAEAEAGMRATVPLRAKRGRASYLGERSRGHQDPGATSTALILVALNRTIAAISVPS